MFVISTSGFEEVNFHFEELGSFHIRIKEAVTEFKLTLFRLLIIKQIVIRAPN